MKAPRTFIMGIVFFAAILSLERSASFGAGESLSYRGALPQARPSVDAWEKDPFVPLITKPQGMPDLKLKAIFYRAERPSAIINDRIVYVDSVVNRQKVIDIGRSHVILQGESGKTKLDISGFTETAQEVKKRP